MVEVCTVKFVNDRVSTFELNLPINVMIISKRWAGNLLSTAIEERRYKEKLIEYYNLVNSFKYKFLTFGKKKRKIMENLDYINKKLDKFKLFPKTEEERFYSLGLSIYCGGQWALNENPFAEILNLEEVLKQLQVEPSVVEASIEQIRAINRAVLLSDGTRAWTDEEIEHGMYTGNPY